MPNQALLLKISTILAAPNQTGFAKMAEKVSSAQLAKVLGMLAATTQLQLQRHLPAGTQDEAFAHSHPSRQLDMFGLMSGAERIDLLTAMSPAQRATMAWTGHMRFARRDAFMTQVADAVAKLPLSDYVTMATHLPPAVLADIHRRMPEVVQAQALRLLNGRRAKHLNAAMARQSVAGIADANDAAGVPASGVEPHSVAAIMTTRFALISHSARAFEALQAVRELDDPDHASHGFVVVSDQGRFMGTLALQDLLHAPADSLIADIADADAVYARTHWPEDATLKLFKDHETLAAPVLDDHDRVVGMLRVEAALDIMQDQITEDFHKGGGTLALNDVSVRTAKPGLLYRKRVFWLVVLVFGNLFSGAGLDYYSEMLQAYIALVFFLPLLVDSGGNAGAQSATMMVRALATGDVVLKDWFKILWREFQVAGMLGLTMAVAVCSIAWWRGGPDIAAVVALSMVLIVILGSVIGMSLPFLLSKFKLDPAAASAPLVTSIADAVGVLIYLSIAVVILGNVVA